MDAKEDHIYQASNADLDGGEIMILDNQPLRGGGAIRSCRARGGAYFRAPASFTGCTLALSSA